MTTDLSALKFTKTHEWLRLEGEEGVVGITQHAQEEISDVVFVELPKAGRVCAQGEEIAVVESVKAAFSIYAPISGTMTEANEPLAKDPGRINRSPYEEGWIFKFRPKNPAEAENLMDYGRYDEWVKGGSS